LKEGLRLSQFFVFCPVESAQSPCDCLKGAEDATSSTAVYIQWRKVH
jgi:hypothetical protein